MKRAETGCELARYRSLVPLWHRCSELDAHVARRARDFLFHVMGRCVWARSIFWQ